MDAPSSWVAPTGTTRPSLAEISWVLLLVSIPVFAACSHEYLIGVGDGSDDAGVAEDLMDSALPDEPHIPACPPALPPDEEAPAAVRWRITADDAWTEEGSAALVVIGRTVLVSVPLDGTHPERGPDLLRFSTDDGSRLIDGPVEIPALANATALAAALGPDGWVLVTAIVKDGGYVFPQAALLDEDGGLEWACELVGWSEFGEKGIDVRVYTYFPPGGFDVVAYTYEILKGDGSWGMKYGASSCLDGFWGSCTLLLSAPIDSGDGFPAVGPRLIAWTWPEGVKSQWTEDGRGYTPASLRARSWSVPMVVVDPGTPSEGFLLVGRNDDPAFPIGMWTERRSAEDLAMIGGAELVDLEALTTRPRPLDLVAVGDRFALIWSSDVDDTSAATSPCLYMMLVDDMGESVSTSVRLDDGPFDGERRFVRAATSGGGVYVMWREGTDLRIVRADVVGM